MPSNPAYFRVTVQPSASTPFTLCHGQHGMYSINPAHNFNITALRIYLNEERVRSNGPMSFPVEFDFTEGVVSVPIRAIVT